jgi:hypothetical protein
MRIENGYSYNETGNFGEKKTLKPGVASLNTHVFLYTWENGLSSHPFDSKQRIFYWWKNYKISFAASLSLTCVCCCFLHYYFYDYVANFDLDDLISKTLS